MIGWLVIEIDGGSMRRIILTQEEKRRAVSWAADESWVLQEKYEYDTEYLHCVQDILDHRVFQSMDQFIQHGETTCKEHCIKVSYLSYCICRKKGWDYRSAARAGLLHDLFLYDWHTHARETGEYFHGFTHPRVALRNAESHFELTDGEKKMILRHMWPLTPIPPTSGAGMAVTYADKFCSLAEVMSRLTVWIVCSLRPYHL